MSSKGHDISLEIPAIIEEVVRTTDSGSTADFPYIGTVGWALVAPIPDISRAMAFIAVALIGAGYKVKLRIHLRTSTAEFLIGLQDPSAEADVPLKLRLEWNAAVLAAGKKYPEIGLVNKGIKNAPN